MSKAPGKVKNPNSFRIIAGKWRSRRLSFPEDVDSLRPTTDRVRETLFNWLHQKIIGARCLDLFAGSGALAFEAASRGAALVTAIDASPKATDAIRRNSRLLDSNQIAIHTADALQWLDRHQTDKPFDVIFLDPPYNLQLLPDCIARLQKDGFTRPGTTIYVEADTSLEALEKPAHWTLTRSKKAGQVRYGVYEVGIV